MKKTIAIIFVALSCFSVNAFCAETETKAEAEVKKPKPRVIRDGFALFAIDGKVIKLDKDEYVFEFEKELTDGRGKVLAGQQLEILKSSALERVVKLMKKDKQMSLRLWGRLTNFRRTNFVFISYFLPMKETQPEEKAESEEAKTEEAEDDVIPADVMEKLRPKKVVDVKQLRETLLNQQDVVIADRTGFVSGNKKTGYYFTFDALGRNVEKMKFKLLNCDVLENVIAKTKRSTFNVRFDIAGMATQYNGKYYLLLQRARVVYSSGNFPR